MNDDKTTRTLIWAVVVITVVVLAATVLLELLVDPSRETDAASKVLGVLAPTIAAIVTLRAVGGVSNKVDKVERDTHALTNGLLDSKVRAGVADVVRDQHLDPDYVATKLSEDQQYRDDAHGGKL